jgi:LuxR family maltose regulon positive regulatory protein
VEEADDLLRELLGAVVPAAHVSALNASTEGWAVGLKMAALSLRGRVDADRFVASFSATNRYVMDYLLEEVLGRQPTEVRDFLLKTSILERLSGPLCNSLIASEGSQRTLKGLENSNLFIVPLDEVGQWYRYHHLFADLLRHQLEATYGMDEMSRLHRVASEWFEHNGLPREAISHALQGKDWKRAVLLIENAADDMAKRGEWNTLLDWFHLLPREDLRGRPRVYGQYANVLPTRGELEAAEAVFAELEDTARTDATIRGDLAFCQFLVAYRRGEVMAKPELAERALELIPENEFAMRARVSYVWGFTEYARGNLDSAQSLTAQAHEAARRAGDHWIGASASGTLSQILWLRGRLNEAVAASREAIDETGQSPAAAVPR